MNPISDTGFERSGRLSLAHSPNLSQAKATKKRFSCDESSCDEKFTRPSDMRRHKGSKHGDTMHWCPYDKCDKSKDFACGDKKGFSRKDKLDEHVRRMHRATEDFRVE
jgi:uncharacterized Zn-finger protein